MITWYFNHLWTQPLIIQFSTRSPLSYMINLFKNVICASSFSYLFKKHVHYHLLKKRYNMFIWSFILNKLSLNYTYFLYLPKCHRFMETVVIMSSCNYGIGLTRVILFYNCILYKTNKIYSEILIYLNSNWTWKTLKLFKNYECYPIDLFTCHSYNNMNVNALDVHPWTSFFPNTVYNN